MKKIKFPLLVSTFIMTTILLKLVLMIILIYNMIVAKDSLLDTIRGHILVNHIVILLLVISLYQLATKYNKLVDRHNTLLARYKLEINILTSQQI